MFFPKNAKILLIYQRFTDKTVHLCCRPPRGGRGLKSEEVHRGGVLRLSPPSRGAWIEIAPVADDPDDELSPPSRGAWIEIADDLPDNRAAPVAPLAGGVD